MKINITKVAVLAVRDGGILRTHPPCNKAMVIPIPKNIQPCCIDVYPNLLCVKNVNVNSKPEYRNKYTK